MTLRRSCMVIFVIAGLLTFLPSCNRVGAKQAAATQYVNLSYNSDGTCQQNGTAGIIDLYQKQPVVYRGAGAAANALSQFQVQFTRCPYASCPVNSTNGSPVDVGTPNANAVGNTYSYSGMTINNQPCHNFSIMGVRIRPGP